MVRIAFHVHYIVVKGEYMAEIRVNATGGLKLYDADDSHYAQIVAVKLIVASSAILPPNH